MLPPCQVPNSGGTAATLQIESTVSLQRIRPLMHGIGFQKCVEDSMRTLNTALNPKPKKNLKPQTPKKN